MQDALPDLFVDLTGINPEVTFAAGGAAEIVAQIEADARADASTDLSTATARAAIGAVAYRVARTKTALDDMGKDHVAHLKNAAKAVDVERKTIRDRLDVLRDELRKPLTDWENAEKSRIDELQAALDEIVALTVFDVEEPTAADIQSRLDRTNTIGGNRDWKEFEKRATAARTEAMAKLAAMLFAAKRREIERAELDKLRQADAERERQAEIDRAAAVKASRATLEAKAEVAEANQRAANAEAEARRKIDAEQATRRAADQARANDKQHRATVNAAARDALCAKAGLSLDLATAVIVAIARGQIVGITVNY